MKTLKVWGNGCETRTLIAAYTKKQALEMMKIGAPRSTMGYFNNYFTETGNDLELSIATEVGMWRFTAPKFQPGVHHEIVATDYKRIR